MSHMFYSLRLQKKHVHVILMEEMLQKRCKIQTSEKPSTTPLGERWRIQVYYTRGPRGATTLKIWASSSDATLLLFFKGLVARATQVNLS